MERKVNADVWKRSNDWDYYCFLRGQKDLLDRVLNMPVEVEQAVQEMLDQEEEE